MANFRIRFLYHKGNVEEIYLPVEEGTTEGFYVDEIRHSMAFGDVLHFVDDNGAHWLIDGSDVSMVKVQRVD